MRLSILILSCICVAHGSTFTYFRQNQAYNNKTCLSEDTVFTDESTSSLAKCSGLCSLDSSCHRIFFNGDLNSCHGCSGGYGDPIDMPSSPGTRCFWKLESCTNDTECVTGPYQRCYDNTCTCKPGYSYDPTMDACSFAQSLSTPAIGCAVYGSEFQVYEQKQLNVMYVVGWVTHDSPDGCKAYCITESWCLSFNYDHLHKACFFLDETVETKPDSLHTISSFSHYNRNCA